MPNFEVLDARIASALNKSSHNSQFKRRISLEEQSPKRGPFPWRQTDCLLDLRLLPGHWNPGFCRKLCRPIHYQSMKWWYSGIRFKVGRYIIVYHEIPTWWYLGRIVWIKNTRVWKLKSVLELYDLETHQKKLGPDYHRLKAVVKRSIEQEIRNWKILEIRNGKNAVVKNQGTKQRVQRIFGDCWQWETNAQCVKGDNCSFRHDTNKRGEVTPSNPSPNSFMQQNERKSSRTRRTRGRSPSVRMSRWPCKDFLRGTCNNSFCEKWHPPECLFNKTKSGCRFGEKCSYAHRKVDEQATKRSKKNDDKSAVAILKKGDWQERGPVTDQNHDRPGKPGKRSDQKLGQKLSKRRSSKARQLCKE